MTMKVHWWHRRHQPRWQKLLQRFRGLPTPLLISAVTSRFVFGMGLGATLATSLRRNWKLLGGIAMVLGAAMAVPVAVHAMRK